jgi:hypothetical protein
VFVSALQWNAMETTTTAKLSSTADLANAIASDHRRRRALLKTCKQRNMQCVYKLMNNDGLTVGREDSSKTAQTLVDQTLSNHVRDHLDQLKLHKLPYKPITCTIAASI